MSFRCELIKMIECHVSIIDHHKYKITDVMKSHFVSFINEFFKCHVGSNDIDFKLTPNFLYAEMDDIRVMIAADASKEFQIPGCNILMREPVEAFILIGESVCYDSVLMRRFRHISTNAQVETFPTYVGKVLPIVAPIVETVLDASTSVPALTPPPLVFNSAPPATPPPVFNPTPLATTPSIFNPTPLATTPTAPSAFAFNSKPASTPSTFSTFSTPPATPAPSMFNTAPTSTPSTFSTFSTPHSTPAPSMFNTTPTATTSVFSTPPATSSGFNFSAKPAINPFNTFSSKPVVNAFGRADSVSSVS